MKRLFLMLIIFLFCLTLPGTLFHYWSWGGIKPDLVMLWVIYIALHHRPVQGIAYGFTLGLIEDLYFGRYLGLNAISLAVVALLIGFLQQRWYRENIPLTMVLVFIVSILGQTLIMLFAATSGLNWFYSDSFNIIFGISLYNALLIPLTYPLIHRSFTGGFLYQKPKFEHQ
ncbi:MAG: rod shape-determining protein MreD [Peptococcaceae bacterium]|nr:rod shape-determining protein MreD [Peptococcaceae bacterium]